MLTVDEATARVLAEARLLTPTSCKLDQALGRILAEEIASDIDSPPFDKALMDGYAIISSDLDRGEASLDIVEEVAAGAIPQKTVAPGQATRIMTGAPIPRGANAVVMVERSTLLENGQVQLVDKPAQSGQNILPKATTMRRGEIVLKKGTRLRPMELGLLAEVGKSSVLTYPAPRCAIVSTGNELVPVESVPAAGQIRNSNSSLLVAQCQREGATPVALGIALDHEASLSDFFRRGLEADLLLISGGVSAGKFDLAPQVLASLGAVNCFRQVALKPGKPLWFGYFDHSDRRTLIFGLPGNPVSSLVCFELFVAPAISLLQGNSASPPKTQSALLGARWTHRGHRPTFHPARITSDDQGIVYAKPLDWKGSADLRTLTFADGLIAFPPGDRVFAEGEVVQFIALH